MMTPRRPGKRFNAVLTCLTAVCMSAVAFSACAHPGHAITPESSQRADDGPPLLTDEQINLINVYEIDLDSDPEPRVTFPDAVLRQFLEEYREDVRIPRGAQAQREWLNGSGAEQLRLMFAVRAREYYHHAQVRTANPNFREWRTIHRQYVLGYFQDYFGDGDVQGVFLFPRHRDSQRAEMTNFYLLTQMTYDGRPFIDRNNPADSLLLQWGLPEADQRFAAPQVERWRPYYRGTDDPRYIEHLEWIESLVRFNQGSDYGIEYRVPGQPADDN